MLNSTVLSFMVVTHFLPSTSALSLPLWAQILHKDQTPIFIIVFCVKAMESVSPSPSEHSSRWLYLELPPGAIGERLNITVEGGCIDQQVKKPQDAFLNIIRRPLKELKYIVSVWIFKKSYSLYEALHLVLSSLWVTNGKF